MFDPLRDARVRAAAFEWLADQVARHGDVLPRPVLAAGFVLAAVDPSTTILIAVVNLAKEKFGMALIGLFVPPVGLVGALRLAKPGSLWARFYRERTRARARARFGEPPPAREP